MDRWTDGNMDGWMKIDDTDRYIDDRQKIWMD